MFNLSKQNFLFQSLAPRALKFFLGRTMEQKGKKEGGLGEGIFALLRLELERFRFPLIKRNPKQKIFQFPLKEKNGGKKKLKKCIEKISVLVRRSEAKASGNAPTLSERAISFRATTRSARGQSGFSAKKVRISSKQYRQFTISAFWGEIASALRASAGALHAPKPHFATLCHAPRGEKETAWFWIWKFVWAKPKAKQSFANQSFFCFAFGET
jgi:hypothetical protein